MDLEEVGLAHTMENLLYTIPPKCEAALGEHPTDAASFERWSNLDMVDRLWWMLRQEKSKVRSLVCISICDILKSRFRPMILVRWFARRLPPWTFFIMLLKILKMNWLVSRRRWQEYAASTTTTSVGLEFLHVISMRGGCPTRRPLRRSTNVAPAGLSPRTSSRLWKRSPLFRQSGLLFFRNRYHSQ